MADDRTIDDILGPLKEPTISIEDIEKITEEKSQGNIKDSNLANIFKNAILKKKEIEEIEAKAANRDNSKKASPLKVDIIDTNNRQNLKDGQDQDKEQGE